DGLTADGKAMAALPLHPRLARLVVEGHRRGHLAGAALLAALLAERDPFRRQGDGRAGGSSRGDHRVRDGEALQGRRSAASGAAGGSAGEALVPPCDSDALARLELVRAAARDGRRRSTPYGELAAGSARRLAQAAEQLTALARRELGPPPPRQVDESEALSRALLAAFPDRLARRRADGDSRG